MTDPVETLNYSNYLVPRINPSRYITGLELMTHPTFKCPRCRTEYPTLEHGETRICPNCSLWMRLLGNGLDIRESTPSERKHLSLEEK